MRRERLTDLRRMRDDPNAIADRVANGLLFGRETPQGHPISGREDSVAAFTRDELVAHHKRLLTTVKPTFLVVGDVTSADAIAEIEKTFTGLRGVDRSA